MAAAFLETSPEGAGGASTVGGTFAEHGPRLRKIGVPVLPVNQLNKKPFIAAFNRMKHPLSVRAVEDFARKHPDAGIGWQPRFYGCVVVDVDDRAAFSEAIALFGEPIHIVETARGFHLIYRGSTRTRHLQQSLGMPIDVIGSSGYCACPPSVHKSGFVYKFWKGSFEDGAEPAPFDGSKMDAAIAARKPKLDIERREAIANLDDAATPAAARTIDDGRRWDGFNQMLCGLAGRYADIATFGAAASKLNDQICTPPLDDGELQREVELVWKFRTGPRWRQFHGGSGVVWSTHDEIQELVSAGGAGAEAFALLQHLRTQHLANPDKPFALATQAMADGKVMGDWSVRKYEAAKKLLLTTGKIVKVSDFQNSGTTIRGSKIVLTGRKAATYVLASRF
jgi:hypothetical protein